MGRGSLLLFTAAMVFACTKDPVTQVACDPDFESCPLQNKGNPCKKDADCGDGTCLPDGTCQLPSTAAQPTACANVTCAADHFCSDGVCLPKNASCKPADPACIYVPHGAFEPPVHAWWWPFTSPLGPDDPTDKSTRKDLEYPDYRQVMSTPVVMRLHAADAEPAVVFNSFYDYDGANNVESHGVMRAIHGGNGAPIWTAPKDMPNHQDQSVDGNASIAAGDCMGTGEVCFITGGWDPNDVNPTNPSLSHQHGGLIAFGSDGRFLWKNPTVQVWWGGPAIARLLGPKGPAQIVVGNGVYDGATGKTLCPQSISPLDQVGGNGDGTLTTIADIDLDGIPEIVTGNQAYKLLADSKSATGYTCKSVMGQGVRTPYKYPSCPYGSIKSAETGQMVCLCPNGYEDICPDGFPAVANFAGYGASMGLNPADKHPEIVVVSKGFLRIHDWTGGMLLNPIPLPGDASRCPNGEFNAGGSPTIADFDGDGLPEVGVASQGAYSVWKPGVGFIWQKATYDCSASTGSSVFDFEGKGQATAVYSDQCFFHVFDGKTGASLIQEKNASCTAYEMPLVADLDGSGSARVLVPNNNICDYKCDWPGGTVGQIAAGYVGLKALASPSDKWVNTRSVWNQHTYHVSNVNPDGTLPFPEPNSWDSGQSNSFRQNVQGQGVFSAPDLSLCDVGVDLTQCRQGQATVSSTVYNGGAKLVKPGVTVTFYAELANGQEAKLGTVVTQNTLQPGQSEKVQLTWPSPPQSQAVTVKAVVDEAGLIGDCHLDNNTATSEPVKCAPLG